jgi:DNA helicase-2/ATP-dependent DNA helicase PcrA
MNHLDALNKKQLQAVTHKNGPLMVVAGAGTGKTRVITHRILNLIKEGVPPQKILAITFTNKAANEMKDRVASLLKNNPELAVAGVPYEFSPFIGTFHALGVKILRDNHKELGISRHFTIFDRDDSIRAIKESMKDAGIDVKQFAPRAILSNISKQKGSGIDVFGFREESRDYYGDTTLKVWEKYDARLKKEKAYDFDDLLLEPTQLLLKNKNIRDAYQKQWHYLHVDEYQDTNTVQYSLMKLLTNENNNVCVVGDVDQSIYGWRGADMNNMLYFEKDYPTTTPIVLEENYRSTKTVITAANDVIRKNQYRKEKNLFTSNPDGEPIELFVGANEGEEAMFVAQTAKTLIKSGVPANEIAVLFRANFQSRVLEEAFLSYDVPYQVLGVRFFERKEVKDVLSYLAASLNSASVAHLSRIVNVPPRGIGKVTLMKIATGLEETLSGATRERVSQFRDLLAKIQDVSFNKKPSETIKYIITESGLEKQLSQGDEEQKERLENLKELVTFASKYDHLESGEGISKLLEEAALASDQDRLSTHEKSVKLMTVHAAKGLEFDHVFITGLEGGLFPHDRDPNERPENQEEERRLFYVAITRAKKQLYLTFASTRMIYGSRDVTVPSEFLSDIDESLLRASEPYGSSNLLIID